MEINKESLLTLFVEGFKEILSEFDYYSFIPKYLDAKISSGKIVFNFKNPVLLSDLKRRDLMVVRYYPTGETNDLIKKKVIENSPYPANLKIYKIEGLKPVVIFGKTYNRWKEYESLEYEEVNEVYVNFDIVYEQIFTGFGVPRKITIEEIYEKANRNG